MSKGDGFSEHWEGEYVVYFSGSSFSCFFLSVEECLYIEVEGD